MSKHNTSTFDSKKAFTIVKTGEETKVTLTADFKKTVLSASEDIGRSEAVMVNLAVAYQHLVTNKNADPKLSMLAFFKLFIPDLPTVWGKPGDSIRKRLDSDVTFNRLRRMRETGARILLPAKKPLTASQRNARTTKEQAKWAAVAKKYKLTAGAITAILTDLLGRKKESYIAGILAACGFEQAKAAVKAMKKAA